MVRIAVETMFWSSAAKNMPSMSPTRIVRICRWVKVPAIGVSFVTFADPSSTEPATASPIPLLRQLAAVHVIERGRARCGAGWATGRLRPEPGDLGKVGQLERQPLRDVVAAHDRRGCLA